ncbi:C-type lectin domain family 4 member D-like isoform X2 [Siniperca chuatsi]|uniref:C-type lectin domain family 4 member D-like isoform X2 n=1 Tax=Siniperca chuatsi TaxID=119488 RepID=UPI001CE21F79|nr:C-type lectin domain family 4 member D-like isoform X2 [Siniperca chuatsi]
MNLIKSTLGIRGHTILYVLIGLLVSEASPQAADRLEAELSSVKLRLHLLENRYRHLCNFYSNLATNSSLPVINCTECPDKWLQVGDQCFFLITDKQDWSFSAQNCREMGGHLAILTTREQHEAVEKEGRRIAGFYTNYWIGLTDIENEGDWKWVDNSTLTNPFWNVAKSEPDNNQSNGLDGEDCAVVDSYTQTWYDVPCSFLYPRICQMDAIPLQ